METPNNGIAKIATITTKSLSNAFVNFKKNQEINTKYNFKAKYGVEFEQFIKKKF